MKLVADQIKLLRERKRELIQKRIEYNEYLTNHREKDQMDGIGNIYTDYAENDSYRRALKEIEDIDRELTHADIITDRNYDQVDVGTGFYARFDGEDDRERLLLVEKGITNTRDYHMISLDSDFGRAVKGATDGDRVVYTVQATGRKIGVNVEAIDRISAHYEHFIREKKDNDRMSTTVRRELKFLKEHGIKEYEKRQRPTESQKELIREELERNKTMSSTRKAFLSRLLDLPTAVAPDDHTIGAGSYVTIAFKDDKGRVVEREFEFINRAYTSELESHYVEAISPLGNSLMGLRVKDTFKIRRKNQPSLTGIVTSVGNYNNDTIRVK